MRNCATAHHSDMRYRFQAMPAKECMQGDCPISASLSCWAGLRDTDEGRRSRESAPGAASGGPAWFLSDCSVIAGRSRSDVSSGVSALVVAHQAWRQPEFRCLDPVRRTAAALYLFASTRRKGWRFSRSRIYRAGTACLSPPSFTAVGQMVP